MTTADHNGHSTAAADQQAAHLATVVHANYQHFAQRLAAIGLLLADLPLTEMLTACQRHQRTSVLTLPAQVTAEQAQAQAASLRADEKMITAALNLQRVRAALLAGQS